MSQVSTESELGHEQKNGSNKTEDNGAGQSRRNIQMKIVRKLQEDFDQCNDADKRLKIATVITKLLGVKIGKNAVKQPLFS